MTVGVSGRGAAHDAIRSMLEARAERLRPAPFDVPGLIADVPQAGARLGWIGTLAPRLSVAGAAVAVVLVTSALVVGPLVLRPAGSEVSSASSAAVTSPGASNPAPEAVRMLVAAELGDLARTRSADLASRLAAVRGTITVLIDPGCSGVACATATLEGAGDGFVLRPSMALVTEFTREGRAYASGVFVVQFTSERERVRDQPVVEVLGRLITERVDSFTSSVRQLVAESPGRAGTYAAVDGWLVRTALHPCPSIVVPSAAPPEAPVYGCPADEYLTDEAFQPTRPGGGSVGPERAIYLPVGSYQLWAPDPLAVPDGGVAPRRAVYLLQKQQGSGCPGVGAGCALRVSQWGVIAGRLEPIPAVLSGSPPANRPSSPSPIANASGDLWTVADLLAIRPEQGAEYVVRGWLVATPPLRCRSQPVPPGLPDYGCAEVDWLTDEWFQPWVTTEQGGEVRAPDVGIRVQNGAYAGLEHPSLIRAPSTQVTPRLGTWLVRFSVRSTCEYAVTDPGVACAGGPLFTWELIRRM